MLKVRQKGILIVLVWPHSAKSWQRGWSDDAPGWLRSHRAERAQSQSCRHNTAVSGTGTRAVLFLLKSLRFTWLETHCWCLGGPSHGTNSPPSEPGSLCLQEHPGSWVSAEMKDKCHSVLCCFSLINIVVYWYGMATLNVVLFCFSFFRAMFNWLQQTDNLFRVYPAFSQQVLGWLQQPHKPERDLAGSKNRWMNGWKSK